eukprot:m.93258 g.93258  ORF g.93258 m.93258 type:complete len:143 (-) comp16529_c0_seq7:165-593(-)
MSLALLGHEQSSQGFPEAIEDFLEDGIGVTAAFNRRGSLLAVGCNDGRVIIWDFDTRGVARVLSGHVETISSVSWSRNGRRLISASGDWHVIVWDVLGADRIASYKFDGPMLSASMHPRLVKTPITAFPLYCEQIRYVVHMN